MILSGRDSYKDELTKLAQINEKIVCIEADLGGKNHPFQEAFADRFFNLGIAEMTSIDMAAGLAENDYIPFFSTFSAFASLRSAESIKLAMGYMGKNIKIVAPYGGVSGGWFGTTHHCLEDIGILQTFPGIKIACPHGEIETRRVIQEAVDSNKPYYIRLGRNDAFESLDRSSESCSDILFENNSNKSNLCVISIGEQATELCKQIINEDQSIVHAHLCYVDLESLRDAIKHLNHTAEKFLVVEEHRLGGSIASTLSLLMPEKKVYSFNCGESWPKHGGTHRDVLHSLNFSFSALQNHIKKIG